MEKEKLSVTSAGLVNGEWIVELSNGQRLTGVTSLQVERDISGYGTIILKLIAVNGNPSLRD